LSIKLSFAKTFILGNFASFLNIFDNLKSDFIKNDFIPNPNYGNDISRNFANIGYNDLHGDLPNFVPGYNDYYGRPRGNLMGPEAFNIGGPGGIRYDPITPFGPRFDFIPQYDGPMKRTDPRNDIDLGIPKWQTGNSGFNNFKSDIKFESANQYM